MKKSTITLLVAGAALLGNASLAMADGHGLSRAAQAAGRGTAVTGPGAGVSGAALPGKGHNHSEMGKSAFNRSGQGNGMSGAAHGKSAITRSASASGLNHALKNKSVAPTAGGDAAGGSGLGTADRIRDHRFSQAEHLRKVGEANGNERLKTTADRMETSAQRNFDRRSNGTPTTLPTSGDAPTAVPVSGTDDGDVNLTFDAPKAEPRTAASPKSVTSGAKGSWIPSWTRKKSGE